MTRTPIRFDAWYRLFSTALFLFPSDSYVEIDGGEVVVRMGWGFRARFPRSAVATTGRFPQSTLSRGVHGFAGSWLVNGAGDSILSIELIPEQRARVLGIPVRLKQLRVSVDDPEALAAQLKA